MTSHQVVIDLIGATTTRAGLTVHAEADINSYPRGIKIPSGVLDHRRFWDAMHQVTMEQLTKIEERIALAMVEEFGLGISTLALDMTNFATYIDSGNKKAPIAQRGKAKQKRTDLRLVGSGWVWSSPGMAGCR